MKALFIKRFFIAYLLSGSDLSILGSSSILAQTQNVAVIPVALPNNVTVKLKQGTTLSGLHLLEINSQTKQVKLEQSGKTGNIDIATIEKITFNGKVILKSDQPIIIRGEGNDGGNCGNQETWNLPLSDIKVVNTQEGKAEINLSSMPRGRQREITQRSQNLTFIIDEIQFSSTGKTDLRTTPCRVI